MPIPPAPSTADDARQKKALDDVAEALARLRFGEIRLSIHDSRVVQVDVTERTRFQAS